ncbi:MAG: hypothetical protein H6739_04110 [Alphaproteobacteria bacterium]|nr:hypothetical protein [Alphaproteobacteria bacterium]
MIGVLLALALHAAQAVEVVVPDSTGLRVEDDTQALVDEAYAALAERRFNDAAELFGALAEGGAGEDARYLRGLSLYEAGELRAAAVALEGLSSAQARNVLGLCRVDMGDPEAGIALLEAARAEGSAAVSGRAALNLGLVRMDQGALGDAEALFRAAADTAASNGDAGLERAAAQSLAALAARRGQAAEGGLDQVADALRRGAIEAAAAEAERLASAAASRRDRVEAGLAAGAVLRARGQPDHAVSVLTEALAEARAGGLARETAQALASLGVSHALAGRLDLGLTLLAEAEETARTGGYRVSALDYGVERAMLAVRQERVDAAAEQLPVLEDAVRGMEHPLGRARVHELDGAIHAARREVEPAEAAFAKALQFYEARGFHGDAARVAVSMAGLTAEQEPDASAPWRARALAAFEQASDPLGPAHVDMAIGLARARVGDLEGALAAFSSARETAAALPGAHARFVASTAEINAARALVALGATEDAARVAAAQGLDGAIAHNAALQQALNAYDAGLNAYDAGRFQEARRLFEQAASGFAGVGESSYEARARRALAWSAYNIAVALPPAESFPFWGELVGEAARLEDVELEARAATAAALTSMKLGTLSGPEPLLRAAEKATAAGLPEVAARAWGALAELDGPVEARAGYARKAFALAPDEVGAIYAMYAVSVDAYNADRPDLARALAAEVLPRAGDLRDAVEGVLEATAEQGP